jgi:hypothetical protein
MWFGTKLAPIGHRAAPRSTIPNPPFGISMFAQMKTKKVHAHLRFTVEPIRTA